MKESGIRLEPFDMKYSGEYYKEFNEDITRYQWPDPFKNIEDAEALIREFLDEMEKGETLFYSILSEEGAFLGSAEMHGLSGDCPEIGVWIASSEQRKGYAYEALRMILEYARTEYHKTKFFYEADIRNQGSMKLLKKFEDRYEIIRQDLDETVTDSGKELKLQGYILSAKIQLQWAE